MVIWRFNRTRIFPFPYDFLFSEEESNIPFKNEGVRQFVLCSKDFFDHSEPMGMSA